MTAMATIEVQQKGVVVLVRLVGEVDLSNVDIVRSDLLEPVGHETESLIIDLSDTQYLDSTGIRMLFDIAVRLHARRQRLRLVVSDETIVRRVLILTKLDQSVPFDRSVDAALAACK